MSKVKFTHASGNSMSIAAPASNPASNLELKLPATIGSADQLLKVDGSGNLGWATDSAGKILQVVSANTSSGTTTTSTSLVDTGLTATITPTSSSSKILVFATGQLGHYRDYSGQGAGAAIIRTISSTATTIYAANDDTHQYFDNGQMVATNFRGNWSTMVEDSPSTTSACVYKVQILVYVSASSGTAYFNSTNTGKAWMHLMEVAS